jgi:tRNA A37 threonylcarbamoyladenosine biosynthesis protein TsaE
VRAAARDDALPVPSPTFLLQNVYDDHPGPPIHHYDLYRLTQPHDLARLDLPASLPAAVSLIEWPDRMGAAAPRAHLALRIAILGEAEQRALQERLQQGAAAAQQQQQGEDEEEAGKEEEEEEEEDGGGDGRWRRIELAGQGQRRRRMLEPLGGHVRAHGRELGLWLDPETAG